jgi:hypothetical protein
LRGEANALLSVNLQSEGGVQVLPGLANVQSGAVKVIGVAFWVEGIPREVHDLSMVIQVMQYQPPYSTCIILISLRGRAESPCAGYGSFLGLTPV